MIARLFLTLPVLFGLGVLSPSILAADAKTPPNILYIMADDHAAQAVSAYGSTINKTPNIDRLAREGMLLSNCFVTNSICTPSRAAILTGKYGHINGVLAWERFDGSQPTLPKYLQAAGYHTGVIGKWHLGTDPTGFDYWSILPGHGTYHNPIFLEMGSRKQHQGYTTDLIADFSMEFIRNRPKNKPFFLLCHHKAPHRPWQPDAKHAELFKNLDVPEPETFDDDESHYATRCDAAREATIRIARHLDARDYKQKPPQGLSEKELKRWKYRRFMQDYLACVASVDDNVGRLLDYLDKNGLAENTIVIYTSDQGFFLGEHGWFDKRFMYEEALRMPVVIRWPSQIKAGSVCDRIVLNVDFAPTLLEAARQAVPADMQGRSFLSLLRGNAPADWRTAMYYRYYNAGHVAPQYGIRTSRYKLIHFDHMDQWELYDLQEDPREVRNVYDTPTYQATVKQLKQELFQLKKTLKDNDRAPDPKKYQ